MITLDTVSISSCSDVVIRAIHDNELIVLAHEDAHVRIQDNLLLIRHEGKHKISRIRIGAWFFDRWLYYLAVFALSLIIDMRLIYFIAIIFLLELFIIRNEDNRIAYCNFCSRIDQSSRDDKFITHHIKREHNIKEILTNGLGDLSLDLQMAPVSAITSNSSGNISLAKKTNKFVTLSVKLRHSGNILLGDSFVSNAYLFSEGSGIIRDILIDVKGTLTAVSTGDIMYTCSCGCVLKKESKGRGKLRQLLQ